MSYANPGAFTEPMDRTDAIYFTVTVFATVGFGDIAPVTTSARVVVTLQMVGDLLVLGVLLQAIVGAVKLGSCPAAERTCRVIALLRPIHRTLAVGTPRMIAD